MGLKPLVANPPARLGKRLLWRLALHLAGRQKKADALFRGFPISPARVTIQIQQTPSS